MEIQPRRDILELWRATIDYSYHKKKWTWRGRSERNSVSDAEQLLTILYPATVIESLKVGSVDETADDVLESLHSLGNALDIPRRLVEFISDYMSTYLVDGTPDFSGGAYFKAPDDKAPEITHAQRNLDVVDSYSMSLTLCLSTLEFLRVYQPGLRSQRMLDEVEDLRKLCSQRLTAAMVGLLRSFTVNIFEPSDESGQTMRAMISPSGVASENVLRKLLDELDGIRNTILRDVKLGLAPLGEKLENRGPLFECGWSWGVVDGAPEIDLRTNVEGAPEADADPSQIGKQSTGVAEARPYLYFTVAALDGIQDLFSKRTRMLGLLNPEQDRLARALQLRWDLTQQFWTTVATFGKGEKWPMENLPWTTTDGRQSDYQSLLLTSIVIQDAGTDTRLSVDLDRIRLLLAELANRGRITSRLTKDDSALALHVPGVRLTLFGSEKVDAGPTLQWTVPSYSVVVLKRLLRVAELLSDTSARVRALDLADQIWNHIELRRITAPESRGLWDEPAGVFGTPPAPDGPSWHQTERVMEALVAAAIVIETPPTASPELVAHVGRQLAEAEHLFDQERLRGTNDTGEQMRESFQVVGSKLRRARELLSDRPATASALVGDVLRELDMIDAARQDTARMS
jgi:hypothetical protein